MKQKVFLEKFDRAKSEVTLRLDLKNSVFVPANQPGSVMLYNSAHLFEVIESLIDGKIPTKYERDQRYIDKLEAIRNNFSDGYFQICINKSGLWDICFQGWRYVGKPENHFTGTTLGEAAEKAVNAFLEGHESNESVLGGFFKDMGKAFEHGK